MATPDNYTQLTSITREKVMPGIVDEITKTSPALKALFAGAEQLDGGKYIEQAVKFALNTQANSYAGLEVLGANPQQTRTRVKWDWKQSYQPITLSNLDIAKNGGESKIVDLMSTELKEAKEDFQQYFATKIWGAYTGGTATGNAGKDIDSIPGAIDDGSVVTLYGDVDRSTHTWFSANRVNGAGALALAKMREAFSRASDGDDAPNLIVTTPNGVDAYEGLLTATTQFITNTGQAATGDASVAKVNFRGVKIDSDRNAPSLYMWMANTKYLKFITLKHPDFPTDKSGFAMSDLQRPANQDGKIGFIFWYGNLICTAPRRQSAIYGITNATTY